MKHEKKNTLTWILVIGYIILLIWIVLFKMLPPSEVFAVKGIRSLNIIPFFYDNENSMHLSEVLENVAIFIPFGVFLGMLKTSAGKTILAGFLMSLAFEVTQYAFAIGAADITDLITNTAGAAIGVAVYGLLSRAVRDVSKLNKVLNIIALIGMMAFLTMLAVLFFLN